jgi:hypothetical protein
VIVARSGSVPKNCDETPRRRASSGGHKARSSEKPRSWVREHCDNVPATTCLLEVAQEAGRAASSPHPSRGHALEQFLANVDEETLRV